MLRSRFLIPALALHGFMGCALGLDFDDYSNECEDPRFDVEKLDVFCSGNWGPGETQTLSTVTASSFLLSSAVTRFERYVAVGQVAVRAEEGQCAELVYGADIFEQGDDGLVRVAGGIFTQESAIRPMSFAGDVGCAAFPSYEFFFPMDIEILDPAAGQVAIAAGDAGVLLGELPREIGGEAQAVWVDGNRFVSEVPGYRCVSGQCAFTGEMDGACLGHDDCEATEVCCQFGDECAADVDGCKRVRCAAGGVECPDGSICGTSGYCRPLCTSSQECPRGEVCIGSCPRGEECGEAVLCEPECQFDIGCDGDQVCADSSSEEGGGVCLYECESHADCEDHERCLPGAGLSADTSYCRTEPECEIAGHCGIGFVSSRGAGLDIEVIQRGGEVTLLVAGGMAGVFRLTGTSDGVLSPDVHRFDIAGAMRMDADPSRNRVWVTTLDGRLLVFGMETLRDSDDTEIEPIAVASIENRGTRSPGVAIAALADEVAVLDGGIFASAMGTDGTTRLRRFQLDAEAGELRPVGAPLAVGNALLPGVGYLDAQTLAVGLPTMSTTRSLEDAPLEVRVFDIGNGELDETPLAFREIDATVDGVAAALRGFYATSGAIYVTGAASLTPYLFSLARE